jgi:hypothetical protein
MVSKPNERDIEEMEALSHLIEYTKLQPDIPAWKIWDCMLMMEEFGTKMMSRGWTNEDIDEYFDIDSMKEVVEKMMVHVNKELRKQQKI